MAYLLGEIAIGLVIAMIAGFCFGWVARGIRERIRKNSVSGQVPQ